MKIKRSYFLRNIEHSIDIDDELFLMDINTGTTKSEDEWFDDFVNERTQKYWRGWAKDLIIVAKDKDDNWVEQ